MMHVDMREHVKACLVEPVMDLHRACAQTFIDANMVGYTCVPCMVYLGVYGHTATSIVGLALVSNRDPSKQLGLQERIAMARSAGCNKTHRQNH